MLKNEYVVKTENEFMELVSKLKFEKYIPWDYEEEKELNTLDEKNISFIPSKELVQNVTKCKLCGEYIDRSHFDVDKEQKFKGIYCPHCKELVLKKYADNSSFEFSFNNPDATTYFPPILKFNLDHYDFDKKLLFINLGEYNGTSEDIKKVVEEIKFNKQFYEKKVINTEKILMIIPYDVDVDKEFKQSIIVKHSTTLNKTTPLYLYNGEEYNVLSIFGKKLPIPTMIHIEKKY